MDPSRLLAMDLGLLLNLSNSVARATRSLSINGMIREQSLTMMRLTVSGRACVPLVCIDGDDEGEVLGLLSCIRIDNQLRFLARCRATGRLVRDSVGTTWPAVGQLANPRKLDLSFVSWCCAAVWYGMIWYADRR